MKVQVVDREGQFHSIDWEPGRALMEILRDNDMVLASCGGHCICGTCHVYVAADAFAKLPPRMPEELAQLEQMRGFRPESSRLACQVSYLPTRDDLSVVLAAYE